MAEEAQILLFQFVRPLSGPWRRNFELTALFIQFKGSWGIIYAAAAVGLISFVIAVIALRYLDETFHKDLNYVEENGE